MCDLCKLLGLIHKGFVFLSNLLLSDISTFAGYPVSIEHILRPLLDLIAGIIQLDSLKSRLQTIKHPISVPKLALLVYREEGVVGFYRGLWIPLITISFVREYVIVL